MILLLMILLTHFLTCNAAFVTRPAGHSTYHQRLCRQRTHHSLFRLKLSSNDNDDSGRQPPSVLCVGEALYDSLPSGIYLGGAPSNVAVHLASLFRSIDDSTSPTVAIAACLGKDQLGREAHRRFAVKGVRTDFVQYHEKWETGMATAILDENGDATYDFNTPAAWDGLQMNDQIIGLMQNDSVHTKVFIMGTISARLNDDQEATSSSTLKTIRKSAPEGTVVLDVNLRSPWYRSELVLDLAKGSEDKKLALLKLNEEELCILEEWCGLDTVSSGESGDQVLAGSVLKQRMEQLATSLNTQRVCVTRGEDGAALLCIDEDENNIFYENEGYAIATNNDSDTVGAGDSFLAALVCALFIQHESPEKAIERACALGAYVASCRGATPEIEEAPDDLRSIFSS